MNQTIFFPSNSLKKKKKKKGGVGGEFTSFRKTPNLTSHLSESEVSASWLTNASQKTSQGFLTFLLLGNSLHFVDAFSFCSSLLTDGNSLSTAVCNCVFDKN